MKDLRRPVAIMDNASSSQKYYTISPFTVYQNKVTSPFKLQIKITFSQKYFTYPKVKVSFSHQSNHFRRNINRNTAEVFFIDFWNPVNIQVVMVIITRMIVYHTNKTNKPLCTHLIRRKS